MYLISSAIVSDWINRPPSSNSLLIFCCFVKVSVSNVQYTVNMTLFLNTYSNSDTQSDNMTFQKILSKQSLKSPAVFLQQGSAAGIKVILTQGSIPKQFIPYSHKCNASTNSLVIWPDACFNIMMLDVLKFNLSCYFLYELKSCNILACDAQQV